jgi:hypothetical protein
MARGLGPTRHASWPRAEEAKPPRAVHVTAQRLRAFLHFRPDQRVKGRAAMQAACNRAKWAHPSDFQRTQHGGPGPRVMQPARQKRYATSFDFVSFSFSSFSLLQQGPGKGDTPKRILLREGNKPRASLLIRGSKAGPSEGFNSRLRALGFHAHYWSEV